MRIFLIFLSIFPSLFAAGSVSMDAVSPVTSLDQLQFENDVAVTNTIHNIPQDTFYIKPIYQIKPYSFIPMAQVFRIKMLALCPAYLHPYKRTASTGDTQLLDLFIVSEEHHLKLGIGAIAILPTATTLIAGQGKWQLGPAFGMTWRIDKHWELSFLIQNPYSLFGNSRTTYVKTAFIQPNISYHFGDNQYLISNAEWTLQYNTKKIEIPVNIGIGKVFDFDSYKIDASLQSEWMAYKSASVSTPKWTLKLCFNILR